jgi:hypothetical protein
MRSLAFMLALCAALVGMLAQLARARRRRARREFARVLRAVAEGTLARFEWNDFLAAEFPDSTLREIRAHVAELPARYPPESRDRILGGAGVAIVEHYLEGLEAGGISKASRSTTGR